jgi:hypothetical protein
MMKEYWKPTPKLFRKIGDGILLLGTTLSATLAGMEVDKGWIIGAVICTALGKVITNFFTEEDLQP